MAGLHRLNALQVKAAKPGATLVDGGGLYLRVNASGAGRWVFRFTLKGQRQREMGLGTVGDGVTLAEARTRAAAARVLVASGTDPIAHAEEQAAALARANAAPEKGQTFGEYVERYLPAKLREFSSPKHRYQWEYSLRTEALPLHDKELAGITRADVLDVLRPIWDAKHVTAQRVRQRIENLFDHAIQNEAFHQDNPARWELFNATLSKPRKREGKGPHEAMPRALLPGFMVKLREAQAGSVGALALEFVILTVARSGEAREARWGEIDFDAGLWNVPSARLKVKKRNGEAYVHTVPLSPRALAVLELARGFQPGAKPAPDALIFPGQTPGQPLTDMTLRARLRIHAPEGSGYTVHGFRSTFRDWAGNDTEYPRELAEEALCHALPDVEASYRREQAVERRRPMMAEWADLCDGKAPPARGSNVVPIRANATASAGGAA